jgi:FkbM family methyltransferase
MELSRQKVYRHWRQRLSWWQHFLKAYFKHKERPRVERLAAVIPTNAVIFDVGAHFGYLAKEFARIHEASCQVYCFEPVSYTHSILKRVMKKHVNATLEFFALSDGIGKIDITIPVKPSGRLGIGLSHFGSEHDWDYITEPISTNTLDNYVRSNGLKRLDFIKIDVEGAELLVLKGAAKSLEDMRPVVYCEVESRWTQRMGYQPSELFQFMKEKSYLPYVLEGNGLVLVEGYQEEFGDYLFLPRESIDKHKSAQA